jgi:hypothetical protein
LAAWLRALSASILSTLLTTSKELSAMPTTLSGDADLGWSRPRSAIRYAVLAPPVGDHTGWVRTWRVTQAAKGI